MSCGIYQFINKINGKIYIGQSVCIERRKKEHFAKSRSNESPFHKAIQKYGKNNFELIILEECLPEQLNEREQYWIAKKNSENRTIGYNRGPGGEGGSGTSRAKIIEQYTKDEIFIRTYNSLKEASEKTGIPQNNISQCCHLKRHTAGGFKWKYEEDIILDYPKKQPSQYCYTKKTGRPSAQHIVEKWQKENPYGIKADCIEDTGLSRSTVFKYWKNYEF